MFVTILALAIGNILMTCAEIAGGLRHPVPERIQLSWIFLMLLVLLGLFWQTLVILDKVEWLFVEFLYFMAGPMMLLFAASVITAPAKDEQGVVSHSHYFGLCRRFFVMLALQQAWVLGVDYWYADLTTLSLLNVAMLSLFLILAVSSSLRIHVAGATLIWSGYIVALVLRTLVLGR